MLFLALIAIIFFSGLIKDKQGEAYFVTLGESGFVPQNISIKQGDSITFRSNLSEPFWPASDLHPTHGIYPEFDPQEPVEASSSWQFTFDKKGSFKYHDHLNPLYRGTIIVE